MKLSAWLERFNIRHQWHSGLKRNRKSRHRIARRIHVLRIAELLEDRTLLATITVTGPGDLIASGDCQITLREAIQAAINGRKFSNSVNILNTPNGSGPATIMSRGINISDDAAVDLNVGIGDLIDTDALLGPLQDNGGPTPTHALLDGGTPQTRSPAIDRGNAAVAMDPSRMPWSGPGTIPYWSATSVEHPTADFSIGYREGTSSMSEPTNFNFRVMCWS